MNNTGTLEKLKERSNDNEKRILFIDKNGWPIESIKGRPVLTFIRRLFLTRRFEKYGTFHKKTGIFIRFD